MSLCGGVLQGEAVEEVIITPRNEIKIRFDWMAAAVQKAIEDIRRREDEEIFRMLDDIAASEKF